MSVETGLSMNARAPPDDVRCASLDRLPNRSVALANPKGQTSAQKQTHTRGFHGTGPPWEIPRLARFHVCGTGAVKNIKYPKR